MYRNAKTLSGHLIMNLKNRRDFLKTGAAFSALAMVGTDFIPASGQDHSLGDPVATGFRQSLGKTVYLLTETSSVAGTVTEVTDYAPLAAARKVSPIRLESFTVKIAHEGPALPQGTYDFVSEAGGRQPLLFVPLPQTDADGNHLLVATFGRIAKTARPRGIL